MTERLSDGDPEQRVDGLACPLGRLCVGATEGCNGQTEQFVLSDIVHGPFGKMESGAVVPRCGLPDTE